jgi:hypothetical protein
MSDRRRTLDVKMVYEPLDVRDSGRDLVSARGPVGLSVGAAREGGDPVTLAEPRCQAAEDLRRPAQAGEQHNCAPVAAPVEVMQFDAVGVEEAFGEHPQSS